MKKCNLFALAGMFILMLSVSAFAADPVFYTGVNVGLSITGDSTYKDAGVPVTVTYDTGYAFGAFGGYAFDNNVRAEVEIGYKSADTDKMKVSNGAPKFDSTVSNLDFMLNAFYDIKTPYIFGITPYVGGGIGVAYLMTTDGTVSGVGGSAKLINDSGDAVFAYQVAIGAAYDVTPKIALDLSYRYFGTTDGVFESIAGAGDAKVTYDSHNIVAGLRYKF